MKVLTKIGVHGWETLVEVVAMEAPVLQSCTDLTVRWEHIGSFKFQEKRRRCDGQRGLPCAARSADVRVQCCREGANAPPSDASSTEWCENHFSSDTLRVCVCVCVRAWERESQELSPAVLSELKCKWINNFKDFLFSDSFFLCVFIY